MVAIFRRDRSIPKFWNLKYHDKQSGTEMPKFAIESDWQSGVNKDTPEQETVGYVHFTFLHQQHILFQDTELICPGGQT